MALIYVARGWALRTIWRGAMKSTNKKKMKGMMRKSSHLYYFLNFI
jgi:hypothetical protein